MDRLGNKATDGIWPFAQNRLFQRARRRLTQGFTFFDITLKAIGVGGGDMREARHARLEHGPVGVQPCGAHGGQGDAMVGVRAGDNLGLVWFAQPFPVMAHRLKSALVRFCPTRGKESGVQGGIGHASQFIGQLNGRYIGRTGIVGAIGQRLDLLRRGGSHLFLTVANVDVPKSGKAVDQLAAIHGMQPDAFTALKNNGRAVKLRMVQRMQQMGAILF